MRRRPPQGPEATLRRGTAAAAGAGPLRLLALTLFVVAVHGVAASMTETVFMQGGFRFGWFYSFLQSVCYAVFGSLRLAFARGGVAQGAPGDGVGRCTVSGWDAFWAGAAMTVSHGCGVAAYVYVNYTTVLVFKSAKVPTVMLGAVLSKRAGSCLLRSAGGCEAPSPCSLQPTHMDFFWAICMMVGLALFGLGDKLESPRFGALGLALVGVNLLGSSATANLQQRALKRAEGVGTAEVCRFMVSQYFVSSAMLFAWIVCSGELQEAAVWCAMAARRAGAAWISACMLADMVFSYAGIEAVMVITQEFDATRANVVCSARKALTFALSYWIWPKPFGRLHAAGLALVCLGGLQLQRRGCGAAGRDAAARGGAAQRAKTA